MSLTSEVYDSCSYQENLRRTVGPGMYMLATPCNDASACGRDIPNDPFLRYQGYGPGTCPPGASVDDGSELRGLNYKNSKCSADQYLPGKYSEKGACAPQSSKVACSAPTESTRLSNPPCTLRGTGWNRWEWLCWNPQDTAMIPFEWNVSNRIVVKDNHVPIIPQPLDQSGLMPPPTVANPSKKWEAQTYCDNTEASFKPGNPWNLTMDSCKNIQQL